MGYNYLLIKYLPKKSYAAGFGAAKDT